MRIFVPREIDPQETRTAITPEIVKRLAKLGAEIGVEAGVGTSIGRADAEYSGAGATVESDRAGALGKADVVLRLRKPPEAELAQHKSGCVHISFLDPFNERPLVDKIATAGISAISMEMVPRITRAQKMDSLSSQASLAGYVAVILAADHLPRIFPMMMTAAGTITSAKVLIIGAGVAGLQAIATARRLGAKVSAFDTRPVVEEQVKSLGASFVKIDLGETGQTAGGYAKALTDEQLATQREGLGKVIAESDVVITTAQVFGRKAPIIITREMVKGMKPGSVLVDCAVESGGNVEGIKLGEIDRSGGITVVALPNLAGRVAGHASQVYANNLYNLVEEFWNKETKNFELRLDDEILKGCLLTNGGSVVHPTLVNPTA
jgi:NAD(P) transhydrogenase subunit alpha